MNKLILSCGMAALVATICACCTSEPASCKDASHEQSASAASAATAPNIVVSAPATACDVTLYGSQFAQVQETRNVANVPAGRARIQLNGIAAAYRADSLRLISVTGPGSFTYLSATYQPANFTPDRLLAESIGKQVTAYRHTAKGLESITGTLQSAQGTQLVISVNGRPELVNTGDVSLLETPQGLSTTASLVVEAEVSVAGTYTFEFQYATEGLSWSARHSLIYDEDNNKLDSWATYVSVQNNSGVNYNNATLRLIAGKVAAGVEDAPGGGRYAMRAMAAPAMVGSSGATVESVGDQNVFEIPGSVTLNAGQSRQIPLYDAATYGKDVPVTKVYVVGTNWSIYGYGNGVNAPQQAGIRLSIANCEKNNLGKPLPAGTVEVQQRKSGKTLQLTGSTSIGEKAAEETFDLNISTSGEVKWEIKLAQRKQVKGTVTIEEDEDENTPVAPAPLVPTGAAVSPPRQLVPARSTTQDATFEDREYELVVTNYKKDKDVDVKVEINGTLKSLPNGWTKVTADRNETTLKVTKSGTSKVNFTTRTQVR